VREGHVDKQQSQLMRFVSQFKPEHWAKFKWHILESPRRWFGFWTLVTMARDPLDLTSFIC